MGGKTRNKSEARHGDAKNNKMHSNIRKVTKGQTKKIAKYLLSPSEHDSLDFILDLRVQLLQLLANRLVRIPEAASIRLQHTADHIAKGFGVGLPKLLCPLLIEYICPRRM